MHHDAQRFRYVRVAALVMAFFGVLAVERAGAQTILRVDSTTGVIGGTGASWASPIKNLRNAISTAVGLGGSVQIWVRAATYNPDQFSPVFNNGDGDTFKTYALNNDIAIYGGFNGTETLLSQRDPAVSITILSGDLNGDDGAGFTNRSDNSLHVVTATGVNSTALLDGFTIKGGNAGSPEGGGLHVVSGTPTITNCIFTDNQTTAVSGAGGAVKIVAGTPVFNSCTFNANKAMDGGGALALSGAASATLNTCSFVLNTAAHGGAIYSNSSALYTAAACTFTSNSCSGSGGAIHNSGGTFTDCVFNTNTAGLGGGAVNIGASTFTDCVFMSNQSTAGAGGAAAIAGGAFRGCTFTSNTSFANGGAVNADSLTTYVGCTFVGNASTSGNGGAVSAGLACVNSRFMGNSAGSFAGAAINISALTGCFFSGNSAPKSGAVQIAGGSPTLTNCTFSFNASTDSDPITAKGVLQYNGSNTITISNCVFFRNVSAEAQTESAQIRLGGGGSIALNYSFVQGLTGTFGGSGNIGGAFGSDPLFINPAGADDQIGTADDDCALFPNSACIDSGNSGLLPADTLDVDGDLNTAEQLPRDAASAIRRIDDPTKGDTGLGSPVVDMGAYESQAAMPRWTSPGGGGFSTGSNWYPSVPGVTAPASFYNATATPITVTFSQNTFTGIFTIGRGEFRMELGAFNLDTTNANNETVIIGPYVNQRATLVIAPTTGMLITEQIALDRWGTLLADGTIDNGYLLNGGELSPSKSIGAGPATLTLTGNYSQYYYRSDAPNDNSRGTLLIDVAGDQAGEYDKLDVQGFANLAGTLRIITPPDFDPPDDLNIEILHAAGGFSPGEVTFDVAYMPGLSDGRFYKIDYVESGGVYLTVLNLGGDLGFGSKNNSAGTFLTAVDSGDLNGDTLPDIAVATSDGFVILLFNGGNDGMGNWLGFTSQIQLSSGGTAPAGIVIADFDPLNANGLDVAVTNSGSDNAVILWRPDTVNWTSPVTINLVAGDAPIGICAVDVDGNGSVDLCTANSGSNTYAAVNNTSAGGISFGTGTRTDTEDGPTAIDPWDTDNPKSASSIVVANTTANTVTFHPNNGNGTFAAFTSFGVGQGPGSVGTEDLNGDENEDIISVNRDDGTLSVILNTGGTVFSAAAQVSVGADPTSLVIADVNNDGTLDVAITAVGSLSQRIVQFLQNSTQPGDTTVTFVTPIELSTAQPPAAITSGDVNQDGFDDIIAVSDSGTEIADNITVRLNVFRSCIADFNRDSFVSGDDFDEFVALFEEGDPEADMNHDSFVSGDDFDLFVLHFEAGC